MTDGADIDFICNYTILSFVDLRALYRLDRDAADRDGLPEPGALWRPDVWEQTLHRRVGSIGTRTRRRIERIPLPLPDPSDEDAWLTALSMNRTPAGKSVVVSMLPVGAPAAISLNEDQLLTPVEGDQVTCLGRQPTMYHCWRRVSRQMNGTLDAVEGILELVPSGESILIIDDARLRQRTYGVQLKPSAYVCGVSLNERLTKLRPTIIQRVSATGLLREDHLQELLTIADGKEDLLRAAIALATYMRQMAPDTAPRSFSYSGLNLLRIPEPDYIRSHPGSRKQFYQVASESYRCLCGQEPTSQQRRK